MAILYHKGTEMISDDNFKNATVSGIYGMLKAIAENTDTINKMRGGEPFTSQINFQNCRVTITTSIEVEPIDPPAEIETPKTCDGEEQEVQHP